MDKKKKVKTIPEKIGARTFQVIDPIFRQRIFVLLNQDQDSYAKFLTKNKIKDTDREFSLDRFNGVCTWLENQDGTRDYLILLKEFDWSIFHQGTLIHEITHCVIKIFDGNNIPFNHDTQEFIAHSISRIYEMIAKKLLVVVRKSPSPTRTKI